MIMVRVRFAAVAVLLLAVGSVFLAGCESIDEKRGYSEIPQNRPANWEINPMANAPK